MDIPGDNIRNLDPYFRIRRKLRFVIWMAVFTPLPFTCGAQQWPERDTSFTCGSSEITLHAADLESGIAWQPNAGGADAAGWMRPHYHSVADLDSVINILRREVEFQLYTFRWDSLLRGYIGGITCRNGMRLIFREPVTLERYYPQTEVAVLSNGPLRTLNLSTGEDDLPVEYADNLRPDMRVVGIRRGNDEGDEGLLRITLQRLSGGKWRTEADLTGLFGTTFRRDDYRVADGNLYLRAHHGWWSVGIKELKER